MSTYIFILGKDPELSRAELRSCYPEAKVDAETDEFLVLSIKKDLEQQAFNRLGGQIKMGEVFGRVNKKELVGGLVDHLLRGHDSGKLTYGVSVYAWREENLRHLLLDLKKELKKRKVSSRFANQAFKNISAAQYKGLSGGKEVLICKQGADYHLAEVLAVQDIDAYSKRDYEKPFRDMKVGMLPPKLAQMMINLTGSDGVIWDPFCGGGVLIMEGLLMGHDMLGSDINAKTLEGAKQNVEWVRQEFGGNARADLFVHDATQPVPAKKFDAIACEGYLGPPQVKMCSVRDFDSIIPELSDLYADFFESLKAVRFAGSVVIGLPFFMVREGEVGLEELIRYIQELGFCKELDLKYSRKDQLVGRQILRFRLML